MPKKKIGIIGGGASGMMAAITAARSGAQVTILEHKDRVGKKILMTGNGKCNLTNLHRGREWYYSHDMGKVQQILDAFTPDDTIQFFRTLGLQTKEKRDGGIYPVAEQASVVLDVLRAACDALHINTLLQCNIEYIIPGRNIKLQGYLELPQTEALKDKKGKLKKPALPPVRKSFSQSFDALVLACGGCAASVSGSDGSGYQLARQLGLKVYEPLPALVQLYGKGDYFKAIAGVRSEADLTLWINQERVASEYGELQITDYGISGIPVFQFSRIVSQAIRDKKQCIVEIDFYPYSHEPLPFDDFADLTMDVFLEGYLHKKLTVLFLKQLGIKNDILVSELSDIMRRKIYDKMHHFLVPIQKPNTFENAQVCAGGVSLEEVDADLSCKKYPNIFLVGELLDADGKCGGYNLQWAWATGYLAGKAAAKVGE